MAERGVPLASLPDVLGEGALSWSAAAARIADAHSEIVDIPRPRPPLRYILGRTRFALRFAIHRTTSRRFLVFFQRPDRKVAILKAAFDYELNVAPETRDSTPEIAITMLRPRMIHPSRAQHIALTVGEARHFEIDGLEDFHPHLPDTWSNLEIRLDDQPQSRQVDRQGRGSWPLRPFLLLLETLRRWVEGGLQGSETELLAPRWTPGGPPVGLATSDATQILASVLSAHRRVLDVVMQAHPFPEAQGDLLAFAAALDLRLGGDGDLAWDPDDEHITLRLALQQHRNPSRNELRMTLAPPDLVPGEELLEALRQALLADDAVADLSDAFALERAHGYTLEDVHHLIDTSFRSRLVTAYRAAQQSGRDLEVFVLRGSLPRHPEVRLIFSATFEVETGPTPSATYFGGEDRLQRLQEDQGLEPDAQSRVLDPFAIHFVRLIKDLARWSRLV